MAHRRARFTSMRRLRALHELGTLDIFRDARVDRLQAARDLALHTGSLATAAMVEVQVAAYHAQRTEVQLALEAARRAERLARRLELPLLAALAMAFQGSAYALAGNRVDMEAAIAESLRIAADQPTIVACAWESRAYQWATEENWPLALQAAEKAAGALAGTPATAPGPLYSLWALFSTAQDSPQSAAARDMVRSSGATVNPINRGYLNYAEAIALGRMGHAAEAATAVARGDADLTGLDWSLHLGRRVMAEAAIAGGWGHPAAWLQEAHAYFEDVGLEKVASACASLLRRHGMPAIRTGRVHRDVPPDLRRLGVTRRELEVLSLLAEGLSNREIAERLYLSPRTVEKHVASLLTRTETRSRTALASWAATC